MLHINCAINNHTFTDAIHILISYYQYVVEALQEKSNVAIYFRPEMKVIQFCNNKTEPWPLFKPLQPLHHTHVVSSNDMKRGTHRYSFHLAATH